MAEASENIAQNCESAVVPAANSILLGHEKAEKVLLDAWKNNSLHNSWLISGMEGIGKATLAYRFARFLLAADESRRADYQSLNVDVNSQVFRLVATDAHPDLKILARDYTDTERRKILKAIQSGEAMSQDELSGLKKSAFIRVDDVRTISEFLSKKSSHDGWRVVIVDSIDDMNSASANAILKILEEPPYKAMMILISHNPNRLLATIKSRCSKLNLEPLDENVVASLLRRYRPQLGEGEVKALAQISSGSIGKAIVYADQNALEIYQNLHDLLKCGGKFRLADMLRFCDDALLNDARFDLVQELVLKYISEQIKLFSQVENMLEVWEKTIKMFDDVSRINMDKKQTLLNVLFSLCKVS